MVAQSPIIEKLYIAPFITQYPYSTGHFELHDHYDDFICVAHILHFKACCVVNSVSTSIKKIIINVLKKP